MLTRFVASCFLLLAASSPAWCWGRATVTTSYGVSYGVPMVYAPSYYPAYSIYSIPAPAVAYSLYYPSALVYPAAAAPVTSAPAIAAPGQPLGAGIVAPVETSAQKLDRIIAQMESMKQDIATIRGNVEALKARKP